MSYILLPMMKGAAEVATGEALPGSPGQFTVPEEDPTLYNRLFFNALLIQGFFTGLVTGKIGEGENVSTTHSHR